jgi:CRP/FNR family transcriptional regulator, nitrogen fixation regulation protein
MTTVRLIKRQSLEAVAESDAVVSRNLLGMTTLNLKHAEDHMLLLGRKTRWRKSPRFCLKWMSGYTLLGSWRCQCPGVTSQTILA